MMNSGKHPASFRDPSGFLYERDGILFRQVNQTYKSDYDLLISSGLYDALLKEDLDRQSVLLSDEARMEKQSSYQLGLKDFKRLYEDAQEELRREDAKLSERILKALQAVIEEYGEKEKYDLIMEKTQSGLMHRNSNLDITAKIILLYDDSQKGQ